MKEELKKLFDEAMKEWIQERIELCIEYPKDSELLKVLQALRDGKPIK